MREKNKISEFSPHLFWDVEVENLSWEKNSAFLVQRLLEYGKEEDWQLLRKVYSLAEIAEIATNLRSLDEVALSFIATIAKVPIQNFRCYTNKSSAKKHG